MNPLVAASAIQAGGSILQGAMFGGGQAKFTPTESQSMQMHKLIPETEEEQQLAALQQALAFALMMSDYSSHGGISADMLAQGEVGGVGAGNLMRGELDQVTTNRLKEAAFGGLQEAGRMAGAGATEGMMGRGMGMSSARDDVQAEMLRPLLAQASQHYGSLYQGELGRQAQTRTSELDRMSAMRQIALQNALMIQQSPALDRLLKIRMAQPQSAGYQAQTKGYAQHMAPYRTDLMDNMTWARGSQD
jgi:hypothetical protein